ncbi:MAG: hypothetical protein ACYCT1_10910 [Steroidobacteraceae bacterium]
MAASLLSGCWTSPSVRVSPYGAPRIVLGEMIAESAREPAVVRSVERSARTVGLSVHGVMLRHCRIGPRVRRWRTLRPGEHVHVRLRERLTVYVPPPGLATRPGAAYVLFVGPSYRLIRVRYPNGWAATLKARLGTPLQGVRAGDSIAVRGITLVELSAPRRDGL